VQLLTEARDRATPPPRRPIPDRELVDAIRAAYRPGRVRAFSPTSSESRICPPDDECIAAHLRRAPRVGSWRAWLRERSPMDPAKTSTLEALDAIYDEGSLVVIQRDPGPGPGPARIQHMHRTCSGIPLPPEFLKSEGDGAWFLSNPVSGKVERTQGDRGSLACLAAITRFPYAVLESDTLTPQDFLAILSTVPIRIVMLTATGGKGVHALLHVGAPDLATFREYVAPNARAYSKLGFDARAITPHRMTRLPGAWRGSRLQELLYLHPNPAPVALADLPRCPKPDQA
jgi:hypothetical protein